MGDSDDDNKVSSWDLGLRPRLNLNIKKEDRDVRERSRSRSRSRERERDRDGYRSHHEHDDRRRSTSRDGIGHTQVITIDDDDGVRGPVAQHSTAKHAPEAFFDNQPEMEYYSRRMYSFIMHHSFRREA